MKRKIENDSEITQILGQMGEQIKLARLRRKIPVSLLMERTGLSRSTITKIEAGAPSVAIGAYASVLHSLGNLEQDLLLVARDDELGRLMQDNNLKVPKRVRIK